MLAGNRTARGGAPPFALPLELPQPTRARPIRTTAARSANSTDRRFAIFSLLLEAHIGASLVVLLRGARAPVKKNIRESVVRRHDRRPRLTCGAGSRPRAVERGTDGCPTPNLLTNLQGKTLLYRSTPQEGGNMGKGKAGFLAILLMTVVAGAGFAAGNR